MEPKFLRALVRHWDCLEKRIDQCREVYPEVLLPYVFAVFETAVVDTLVELVSFDFGNICQQKLFRKKVLPSYLRGTEFNDFFVTKFLKYTYIEELKNKPLDEKIKALLRPLEIDCKGEIKSMLERINDYRKLRNSLVHHDLCRYETLGNVKVEYVDGRYVFNRDDAIKLIELLATFSTQIKERLRIEFGKYTDLHIIQRYWENIFDNNVLAFSKCWNTSGAIFYTGPSPEEYAQKYGSTRVACLLSLFLAAFNGHEKIVYYSDLLTLPIKERKKYQSKFNKIMELHDIIDLQNMQIELSYKLNI
ncbi:hypothetical protein SAMN02745704_00529 [Paucidesulfovibrio gracilis DSM 16080]|uniref:Uncharacterized protein n=1 Tax=Paucidesulfovibrio gracilis DSM 16080 TaxID=1121449 RepID=A0A1T4W929_9BACT|nr:hypothetical protein [Paucidesulfovibrio gracilis]SKA73773.1 hypothetical protein SAMN02745704_00529 [Paucidesulfovibrio gracilis DSM 16080]